MLHGILIGEGSIGKGGRRGGEKRLCVGRCCGRLIHTGYIPTQIIEASCKDELLRLYAVGYSTCVGLKVFDFAAARTSREGLLDAIPL